MANKRAIAEAVSRSETWSGRPVKRVKFVEVDLPQALVEIGVCPRVDYISDKFDGKRRRYFHEFTSRPKIYMSEKRMRNGQNVLLIIGKFKITADGLVR